jgi:hypothetical protein
VKHRDRGPDRASRDQQARIDLAWQRADDPGIISIVAKPPGDSTKPASSAV